MGIKRTRKIEARGICMLEISSTLFCFANQYSNLFFPLNLSIILWFSFYSLCRFLGSSVLTYSSFSLVPFSLYPNTQSIDLVVVVEKKLRLHLTSLLFYTNSLSYFHQYLTLLIHPNTIVRVPLTSSSSYHSHIKCLSVYKQNNK